MFRILKSWVSYYLLIVLVVVYSAIAGSRFNIKTAAGAVIWQIDSTASDTSRVFPSEPTMTIFHYAADSIAQDSVNIELDYQVLGANNQWMSAKKCTVTVDSTSDGWMLTNSAIASGRSGRVVATGLTGNRKGGNGVRLWLTFDEGN
ncbi:MAG: hypothetical protein H8D67_17425 [Deltaproteobacteria bacterium]|nr:hypothetical protein [Deltaproteobacteria bacterium]